MFSRKEYFLLLLLAGIQFTHTVDFMILMPLGPMLMRIFSITPGQFGLLVSSYTVAAGIMGFFASFFVDRFDRKKSLMFFFVGFAMGTLACAVAPSFEALLAARALAGAFGGVLASLVFSIVSDSINVERRGTALGIIMGAFSVASVFGVPLSIAIAEKMNWHAPFVTLGLIAFGILGLVAIFMEPMRSHLRGHSHHAPWNESISHLLKDRNQMLGLLFMGCLIIGHFAVIPYISPSLVANAGVAESDLKFLYLFGGIISMVSSPMAGRLSDKYGRKIIFTIGLMLSLIPIILISNLTPHPLFIVLSITTFFFFTMSGRMVPAVALLSSTATPRFRGSFMSITSSVQQLSAGAASFLASLIVARDTEGHILNYPVVGAIAVTFSLIALFVSRFVHPVEGKDL